MKMMKAYEKYGYENIDFYNICFTKHEIYVYLENYTVIHGWKFDEDNADDAAYTLWLMSDGYIDMNRIDKVKLNEDFEIWKEK